LIAQSFGIDWHAAFLDFQPANAALAQPLTQLSFVKWHHVQNFEASQCGMCRRSVRRIVGNVSSQTRKLLLNRDRTFELRCQDRCVGLENIPPNLRRDRTLDQRLSDECGGDLYFVGCLDRSKDRCPASAGILSQLTEPGDELAALASAADPFQFCFCQPRFG